MGEFFSMDGSVFRFLSKVADLMVLNLLFLVCCIPVDEELDLKKTARAAGDKKVEMIHVKELLPLTGYIRGGCSPIGMKKKFPTYIEETAQLYDRIYVSAGMRGCQVILAPEDLRQMTEGVFAALI